MFKNCNNNHASAIITAKANNVICQLKFAFIGPINASARQVAEHIAGANLFFGAGIAEAIGVTAPALEKLSLGSAADATAKTTATHAALTAVAAKVSDAQMAMEIDHPRLGKQTLGGILGIVVYHYNDHANQLKTLRG